MKEEDRLSFHYLPGYAAFLLEHKLHDYARAQLDYSREEQVPLLKFFAHLPEEQLLSMALRSAEEFLRVFIENRAAAFLEKSTADYIKNQIPSIEREQVVAQDITTISFVRRKTLRQFLPEYTQDLVLFSRIMEEVDRYVASSEERSFNAYLEIQQERIRQINIQLEQRQEQLLEAQDLARMGSFYWNMSGGRSEYTPGVLRIFELPESSSLESFMHDVHEDDRQKLTDAIGKAMKGDGIYECEYRYMRNGHEKRVWSRGIVEFRDGQPMGMKGTLMDVTSQYRVLEQLRNSEELNKQAQALTHIGNWTWTVEDGKITWSDEMYRIYGLEPQSEEITFERFLSFLHPDDRAQRMAEIQESLRTSEAKDYLIRVINPDGKMKVLRGKGEVIVDPKTRNVQQLVGTCQDITKEHQMTRELQDKTLQLERVNHSLAMKNSELEEINKELESFNYVASHDLQEPLRKIQTFTNRILEKGKNNLPANTIDYFHKIIASSSRMQSLIEDLLTFSQTTANESNFEMIGLDAIIDEVKGILSQTIEDKRAVIESGPLPVVRGIPFQLQQLLLNLVSNSLKYARDEMPPQIRITSSIVKGEKIGPAAIAGKQYFEMAVTDNGIGFEEENNEKIFGLFQRLHGKEKYTGTGIGLAICKKIVHNHRGFIKAKGIPGKGAVFYVYLPREVQEAELHN